MSEMQVILEESAAKIFRDYCDSSTADALENGYWPRALWQAIDAASLCKAATPEKMGGAGADLADILTIVRCAGEYAVPVPLVETLLAGWLLTLGGIAPPDGPITVGPVRASERVTLSRRNSALVLNGVIREIPYARFAMGVVVLAELDQAEVPVCVRREAYEVSEGRNIAGEPRDIIQFRDARVLPNDIGMVNKAASHRALWLRGALFRTAQMTGAMTSILDMSIRYASERQQFGRPIAKFQAIQHQLAQLAAHVAAASAATDAAVDAANHPHGDFQIAAAKARVSEAAGLVTSIAHQVHGAMGFAREYPLHQRTRRLWAWRDEFGDESFWWSRIGANAAIEGGDKLWAHLTASTLEVNL